MIKKVLLGLIILFININVFAGNIVGDVNNDGKVNVNDYVLIRKHIMQVNILTGDMMKAADVNADSKISTIDYVLVRRMILGDNKIKLSIPNENNAYYNNLKFIKDNKENPLIAADPSLFYDNGTYYLFATFGDDGIRYYTSKDMIHWEDKGLIINKKTFDNGSQNSFNCFWAPEVFKYNGKYYLLYSGGTSSNWHIQLYLAVSDSLNGNWKYYGMIPLDKYDNLNIDGTILIENNKAYLYYHAKSDIYGVELSSDLKSLVGVPKVLVYAKQSWANHSNPPLNEGPAVLKYNGKYYIMYSANDYYTKWYGVGYATASSPLGTFTDQSFNNPLLTTGDGPGHNSVFTIDGKNYYIVYHSIVWKNNTYSARKLNVDQMGIDSNGKMYINGPTNINLPLPSGHKGKLKINSSEYDVLVNSRSMTELKDGINYNVVNTSNYLKITPPTLGKSVTTNSITINLNNKIEDIWLYSDANGMKNITANLVINDKYVIENIMINNANSYKIQLPVINETINKIQIDFSNNVSLTEVSLYTFGK